MLALIGPASQRTTWERGDGQRVDGRAGAARDLVGKRRGAECLRSEPRLYPVRVRRSTDLVTAFPGLDSQEARNDHALGAWSQPEPPVHAIAGAARPTHPRPTPQWPQPSHPMTRADQAAGTWSHVQMRADKRGKRLRSETGLAVVVTEVVREP